MIKYGNKIPLERLTTDFSIIQKHHQKRLYYSTSKAHCKNKKKLMNQIV
jgi:hypothetical protein